MTIGNVLKEKLDFLARDDVTDIFGVAQVAERQANHLVADNRRSAAVARVDGRVDLNAKARHGKVVGGKFDARDDAAGDR